jgi:hypothetical protein
MRTALLKAWNYWFWILLAVVVSRFFVVFFLGAVEIRNDSGIPVRLAGDPAYLDYGLYLLASGSPFAELGRPLTFIFLMIDDPAKALSWWNLQQIKPGPILPMLIGTFDYQQDRSWLAGGYLIVGGVLGLVWAWGLAQRGVGVMGQLIAALWPSLIYYSFLVSTDLLYAMVLAALFLGCTSVLGKGGRFYWIIVVMMLLALSTRPNALGLIAAIALIPLFRKETNAFRIFWIATWGFVGLYAFIYYLPYYFVHDSNADRTHYWGIYPSDYYSGLFHGLPTWLDKGLSVGLLAVSKVLHAAGIRPSYAELDLWLVIARALPGLLFLPGMIYGLAKASYFERVFMLCFFAPVFVGAAQERYLLPLTPLLMFWAFHFYKDLGVRVGVLKRPSQ